MTTIMHHVPRGITESTVDAAFGIYSAWVRGLTATWANALGRGATPWDVASDLTRWAATVTRHERPQWATEHRITGDWPCARLRDFTPEGTPADTVPVLFLPPQAGHDSCIVDFSPEQSQVRTALDNGIARVASMDWKAATIETRHVTIDDYIAAIHEATQILGGRVNLVGDCQGGWLGAIYASLHPETINTLTVAGAPIDYHSGQPLLHDWLRFMAPSGDLSFYRNVVDANGGVLPGDFMLTSFKALQPHNELDRQLQLLANINDAEYVQRYVQFETWFQWTQPIPGAFYLWIVEHLFMNNELIRGELVIGGEKISLKAVEAPVFLLAGATDHITPPDQVWALEHYVGTPADQVVKRLATAGHLGLFMGRSSLRDQWAPTFAEMAAITPTL